mmetsp:Transcript_1045/g.2341  ORF Transcript_1045/g.2341 Transcript_1045/m.2341 type:complete len:438 (-) Transcript_1045:236-1549(-)
MASEVAPCMPLHLFRRAPAASASRRPRPADICRRLSESLDLLLVARPEGLTAGGTVADSDSSSSSSCSEAGQLPEAAAPPSSISSGAVAEARREELQRIVSEDVRKQLRLVLEAFEEPSEPAAQRAAACKGVGDHLTDSAGQLLAQFLAADLPCRLVASLADLTFEVRKDVISVFSAIVRMGDRLAAEQQVHDYVSNHPRFYRLLVEGYGRPEIAIHCGMMLRSCARHRRLVAAFLDQPGVVTRLISFTSHGGDRSFDVSSDAFSSLHDFLLMHKDVSVVFLETKFHEFFGLYNGLVQSDDYVTQRQALKLLGEILLSRPFMKVMMLYIGEDQFLQIHMKLLRADSKAIQFEAFHIFKIFVANPQKPPRVQQILYKNKDKLVRLLETFATRQDDRQFLEDRNTVIGKLYALELVPPKPSTPTGRGSAAREEDIPMTG